MTDEILECHFMLACQRILKYSPSQNDIQLADTLLVRFYSKFESILSRRFVTPNMHLHLHLKDCIADSGP